MANLDLVSVNVRGLDSSEKELEFFMARRKSNKYYTFTGNTFYIETC